MNKAVANKEMVSANTIIIEEYLKDYTPAKEQGGG